MWFIGSPGQIHKTRSWNFHAADAGLTTLWFVDRVEREKRTLASEWEQDYDSRRCDARNMSICAAAQEKRKQVL